MLNKKYSFLVILIFFLTNTSSLFSQRAVFTLSGKIYEIGDGVTVPNYPVRIYPNINDTTQKYTVYTSKIGYFFYTLPFSQIASNKILLKIASYKNGSLDEVIDTINVVGKFFYKNYYISSLRLKKFIVNGYIYDNSTNSPIANYLVYICNNESNGVCINTHTDKNGYFVDTIFVNSVDTPNLSISVYSYCSGKRELISQNIHPANGNPSLNFNICPQNKNTWHVSFFSKQSGTCNDVYFSIQSNFSVDSVIWNFSDGTTAKGEEIIHSFDNGSFRIKMIAYRNGKSKSFVDRIVIGNIVSIEGKVYASNNLIPYGYVLAYKKIKDSYSLMDFTNIIGGKYKLQTLLRGKYLLYAIPELDIDTNYFPKYIATYKGGNHSWHNAHFFVINTTKTNINIHLDKYSDIYYGNNKINFSLSQNLLDKYDIVSVLLYNSAGEIIDSKSFRQISNGVFKNLPEGIYSIQTEIAGVESKKYTFKLDKNYDSYVNFYSSRQGYIDVVLSRLEQRTQTGISIYPNPFNNYFTVSSETENDISLYLYDLTGRLILYKNIENKTNINTCSLSKGSYLAVLKKGYNILMQKIVIKL